MLHRWLSLLVRLAADNSGKVSFARLSTDRLRSDRLGLTWRMSAATFARSVQEGLA